MPDKKISAAAFTNGGQPSPGFRCEHYGCDISEAGCFARQQAPNSNKAGSQKRQSYSLVNGFCVSGECAQGRNVAKEAEKDPEAFKTRHKQRRWGARAYRPEQAAPKKRGRHPKVPAGWLWCPTCRRPKRRGEFHRAANRKSGFQYDCKACKAARLREYRRKHAEQRRRTAGKIDQTVAKILPLEEVARRHARRALRMAAGNKSKAAAAVGVSWTTFQKLLNGERTATVVQTR